MAISLTLPVEQNWSCHNCGGCCKQHGVVITEAERDRIANQGWTEADGVPAEWYVREQPLRGQVWYRMAHREDGACTFLDDRGLCRIHGKFGEEAKPLACRIYPYVFHPAGGRMTVSMRFSCPSVVRNLGASTSRNRSEIESLARSVVPKEATRLPPPPLARNRPLDWDTFHRLNRRIEDELTDDSQPLTRRLLRLATWTAVLPMTGWERLDSADQSATLRQLSQAAEFEVNRDAGSWLPPGRTARMHFRLLAGQYARKDTYASKTAGLRGRLALATSAWALTRGRGSTGRLRDGFEDVDIAAIDRCGGSVPAEAEAMIERLLRVKIRGLHYCGRPFYGQSFADGFAALLLLVPSIHWLARWTSLSDRVPLSVEHYVTAITSADHHHGFSPALAGRSFVKRVRFLRDSGELRRLVQTYGSAGSVSPVAAAASRES